MTTRSGDLDFRQAHDVYSAFYAAGHADGKSEAKVFGELSLDERKVIFRAIEVLGGRKGTAGSSLESGDRLTPLIQKLVGVNTLTHIAAKDLPNALKGSKPILVQGRAEIGMANRFLVHDKFLKALEPDGELYQKLAGFFVNPHASQKTLVKKVVKEWVENLPPGEGKKAATEALQYLEASINNFSSAHDFTPENLKKVCGDFRENILKELALAWGATPLTKADHQAMGIGALDLLPFSFNKTTIKQKRSFVLLDKCTKQGFRWFSPAWFPSIFAINSEVRGETKRKKRGPSISFFPALEFDEFEEFPESPSLPLPLTSFPPLPPPISLACTSAFKSGKEMGWKGKKRKKRKKYF